MRRISYSVESEYENDPRTRVLFGRCSTLEDAKTLFASWEKASKTFNKKVKFRLVRVTEIVEPIGAEEVSNDGHTI